MVIGFDDMVIIYNLKNAVSVSVNNERIVQLTNSGTISLSILIWCSCLFFDHLAHKKLLNK